MSRILLVSLLMVLCACGAPEEEPESTGRTAAPSASPSRPTPSETPLQHSSPAPTGTQVVVADSEFGPMLFNAKRQAIYLFDLETTTAPKCYGDCAEAWPPVLTSGTPAAGAGVHQGLLGTTRRSDGSTQVTYGGHPLYYYAHEGPGEVECHDIFLNGGKWYVVRPDGNRA